MFLKKKENKQLLEVFLPSQSNQWKMNISTKFSNVSINEKAKNRIFLGGERGLCGTTLLTILIRHGFEVER